MRWLRFALVALVAVLAQVTVMRACGPPARRPDLVVAVLVVFALGVRKGQAFAAGGLLGLGRDLFTVEPFGLGIATLALLGLGLAWLRPNVFADHPVTHAILGFVCAAACGGVSALAVAVQGGAPSLAAVGKSLALRGAETALVAGLLGWLVWRRARWFGLRPRVEFRHV
ncbi:MAG: rod shape-determining protein MreD [Candidatus Brocadiia bacterium]